VCQGFDSSFPHHRGSACPVSLEVDHLSWPVHSRVPGPSAFQMLDESVGRVIGVTSIVTAVIAQENVDII